MNSADALSTVTATLARFGLAETAFAGVPCTLARRPGAIDNPLPLPTIPLALFGASESANVGVDLVVRGELGRGGMGVVHLVEQRSLGREVAVKTADSADVSATRALIREGRVMGSLEHPNILPVHAVGVDSEGAPVLVMKRIEGVSWRELLGDTDHPDWGPLLVGHGDVLRANVEILTQLCRALSFAHERGVVHRDLKPENVMVGRHGEVYLVDWGLALRLSERDGDPGGIVGTPGYLAPEMVMGDPRLVDERTDVYLLGAVLYHVLTDRMPHEAPTPLAALVISLTGEMAPLPQDAPSDLADLVRRAMALSPNDRLASAEAFREGLQRFLASREVDRAVAEARTALEGARVEIEKDGPASLEGFRGLIEARVALTAARRARPRDHAIQRELDACVQLLVERELELRSPDGARSLLEELSAPHESLKARVEQLARELSAERAAAANQMEHARESDISVGLRVMRRLVAIGGAVQMTGLAWLAWDVEFLHHQLPPPSQLLLMPSAVLLAFIVAIAVGRRTILATAGSRRMAVFTLVFGTIILLNSGIAVLTDSPMHVINCYNFVALAAICAMGAATVLPALRWASLVYLAGLGAVLVAPAWSLSICVPTTAGFIVVYWRAMHDEAVRTRAVSMGVVNNDRLGDTN